jgi:8-oxo-dGTP diphosphatase
VKLATLCYVKDTARRQTLMLHRIKRHADIHAGKWNGLGGKFEVGETPEACVIREIREESGLAIHSPQLCGVLTFPAFKDGEDWYVFVFVATEFAGDLIETEEGELAWIDDDQLLSLNLWEGDPLFLQWIEDGRFFSGHFTYVDGDLCGHGVVFHDFAPTSAAALTG